MDFGVVGCVLGDWDFWPDLSEVLGVWGWWYGQFRGMDIRMCTPRCGDSINRLTKAGLWPKC